LNCPQLLFSDFNDVSNAISRPLRAEINLSNFKHNLQVIADSAPASRVLVVIKADAYGHGLLEIAGAAGDEAEFAVAIPEELRQLREAGFQNMVWVLEGPFNASCLQQSRNVVWVIHSLWQLRLIEQVAQAHPLDTFSVCIKLDTGMHRLGFADAELNEVFSCLASNSRIKAVCVMTHFAMSDEPDNQSVLEQISRFDRMISAYTGIVSKHSLANSGAILYYPQSHRDWIRPGIMLYGGKPAPDSECSLNIKQVMCFRSAIIALHRVKKGESVGYGSRWIAQQDTLIATVAVGYADGYPRHAVNGTPVAHINARTSEISIAPLAGRVSMDMITVDVSGIECVQIGDQIELWGEYVSADEVAKSAGTIAYDLFTGVSKRVPRVYLD
jgi:alanine racemase